MVKIGGCAIVKKGKLFLIKKFKNDYFEFPGGKLDLDESFKDAAVRECLEEVGVNPIIIKEYGPYVFEHKGKKMKSYVFLSSCDEDPRILETNIFDKSIWIDLDKEIKIKLATNVNFFIKDYLA